MRRCVILLILLSSAHVAANRLVKQRRVSRVVMERLALAKLAINYTKRVIPRAGNQKKPLKESQGNSLMRMQVGRDIAGVSKSGDSKMVKLSLDVLKSKTHKIVRGELIRNSVTETLNLSEITSLCSGGGNCGEHSELAFGFIQRLRPYLNESNNEFQVYNVTDHLRDHAYSIIGDIDGDVRELVYVDGWMNNPEPIRFVDSEFFDQSRWFSRDGYTIQSGERFEVKSKERSRRVRRAIKESTANLRQSLFEEKWPRDPSISIGEALQKKGEIDVDDDELWDNDYPSNVQYRYSLKEDGANDARAKGASAKNPGLRWGEKMIRKRIQENTAAGKP